MNHESRLLAQIERHLASDDPVLAECFNLWNERCVGVDTGSTDWLLVLTAVAGASLVLLHLLV
ncbi:DUF3040 domain-containing protein [Pseudonocardia saturnea]